MKGFPLLCALMLACVAYSGYSLEFPQSPFRDAFMKVVNGTNLLSPVVTGYGVDHFSPITVGVVRDIYNWSGQAVLLDQFNKGRSAEKSIRKLLKEGRALGYQPPPLILIWGGLPSAGFASRARDDSDVSDIRIPVVEVSVYFWALVTAINNQTLQAGALVPVRVTVKDDDISPLDLVWSFGATLICSILLTGMAIACFVVNIYKFQLHLRHPQTLSIPIMYFAIDNVANIMRFWFVCVNPFYINKFAYTWTTICTTTHMALTIICTLLISLKWQELLIRTKLKATMFLSTFKWPFIVVAIIIFATEFVSAVLRGHWYSINDLPQVSWSFLTIVGFIVTTLLFVSGAQILIQIRYAVVSARRIWQLNRTTLLILVSGFFLLAWSITEMAYLIKIFKIKKITLIETNVITALQFGFLFGCSFCQSWAMPIPNSNTSPSSSTADTTATHTSSKQSSRGDGHSEINPHSHIVPATLKARIPEPPLTDESTSTSYGTEHESRESELQASSHLGTSYTDTTLSE